MWQLARLGEKRVINAAMRAAMNEAPVELGAAAQPTDEVRHRRVRAMGHYDESRQLLMTGRIHDEAPGVEVLTPLVLQGGSVVMVDRGWLAAPDAITARPDMEREPGPREVIGVADSIPTGVIGTPWRPVPADSAQLWATHLLSLDSLRSRLPYAIAPYLLHQLPAADVPARPIRRPPEPLDEGMHLSYAVQWFLFAAASLLGPPLVLLRRKPRVK